MTTELPEYYFRTGENSVDVFRVDTENRQRRIELDQIAKVRLSDGDVTSMASNGLSKRDLKSIRDWMGRYTNSQQDNTVDEPQRAIERVTLTAEWADERATDDQLEQATDGLLLALHDLRTVLVRKKASRLKAKRDTT